VRGRSDHDDGQVVGRDDGAGGNACGEQVRRQGIITGKAALQLGGDPAVGERRGRPGSRRQIAV
jgi:hypothetical protein